MHAQLEIMTILLSNAVKKGVQTITTHCTCHPRGTFGKSLSLEQRPEDREGLGPQVKTGTFRSQQNIILTGPGH